MRGSSIIVIIFMLCLTAGAHGRTWRVEQDGSGDFLVMQFAVDAAADGDSIIIGPGRYPDAWPYSWGSVAVFLDGTKSLTFIGAGPDVTIIGPEELEPPYNHNGIYCYYGDATVRVENLRIQNQSSRGLAMMNSDIIVQGVVLDHCNTGIRCDPSVMNVTIRNCQFINGPDINGSIGLLCWVPHADIRNVLFEHYKIGIHQDLAGSTDFVVTDCIFRGQGFGRTGLTLASGAGGMIERCSFSGLTIYGFGFSNAGSVIFNDNVVENCTGAGVDYAGCQDVTMHGNIIDHCQPCILWGGSSATQDVHGNHFLRDEEGGGYWVDTPEYFPFGPYYVDLTQNYWGTTDTQEISQWIRDGYDSEDVWVYVQFEPIADQPVRTESVTWGEIKSLFRE